MLANIVNIGVAYVLIFGHFGLPALGVAGSAWGAASGALVGAAYMLVRWRAAARRSRSGGAGAGRRGSPRPGNC